MSIRRTPPAFALPLIALTLALPLVAFSAAPATAEPVCSGGGHVADALIVPDPAIGVVRSATQYAWDGGGRLHEVCNLLTEGGDFFATWSLFSGEVDAVYPGICVSLTNDAGAEWYSCQTGDAVAAAFAAPAGTDAGVLRFEAWEPEAPVLQ